MNNKKKMDRSMLRMIILFTVPALLFYLVLFVYPAIKAFYVSLCDWNGYTENMKFIGLSNFKELFGDKTFWNVPVKNTLVHIFIGGIITFSIAFILCAVLSTNIKGKSFLRALIFFPTVVNPVAIAILWTFIYNNKWGLINNFLSIFGIKGLNWMDPKYLLWSVLIALVWMNTGFYCIILLAGLDQVPSDQIEAAKIDGANEFQVFFKVKLPMISSILQTAITLWCINAIKEFALLYAWGGGVDIPPDGATNMAVRMYVTAFGKRVTIFRMGYSTAMGVLMFLSIAIAVSLVRKIMNAKNIDG